METEEYLKIYQEYSEAEKKASDYFKQFLYESTTQGGVVLYEKQPAKSLTPEEMKILEKLWDEEDEKKKQLADFLKKNQ